MTFRLAGRPGIPCPLILQCFDAVLGERHPTCKKLFNTHCYHGWNRLSSVVSVITYSYLVGPCGARGRCRISPPHFLAECRKRRLNQDSFVSAVCLVVCFLWFVLCLCVYFCDLYWVFPYCLFVSSSQVIGCEDRLQNDLYCVGWGVKLYSVQSYLVLVTVIISFPMLSFSYY